MAVRKDNSRGKWLAEIYISGKRTRKWFATKGEAIRFYNEKKQNENPLLNIAPFVSAEDIEKKPTPSLSFYVQEWFELHGKTLSDGKARLTKLKNLCNHLGDPADTFTKEMFADYRKRRLNGEFSQNKNRPPKEATINREHAYLRAMFNELASLEKWQADNPLDGMRLFKEKEAELVFLYERDIYRLLLECDNSRNPDLGLIVRLCLATGARWREVEALTQSQVIPYKITFINTKSKKNRTVPISKELFDMLPKKRGRLFNDAYESFENAVLRAEIDLPKGQLTHVLRHTFASHFMMNGGNILVLKEILGHSTIEMTMRYAHFAPSHLESAVKFNPLNNPAQ